MHTAFPRPFSLIACCTILLAGPARAQQALLTIPPGPLDRITLDADLAEGDAAGRTITASGHVTASISRPDPKQGTITTTIVADTLTADLVDHALTAAGNVSVSTAGHTAYGDRLSYQWDAQRGQVDSAYLRESGLSFRATSLTLTPKREEVLGATFTACGEERPGYVLSAQRVTIVPRRRITAHHVSLMIYGRRVIHVPELTYRLRKGGAQARHMLPIARPGYSRLSGFTLAQPLPLRGDVYAEVELASLQGVRGRADWEGNGSVTPYIATEWKREYPVQAHLPVLVSRLPEAGLRLGSQGNLTVGAGYIREHTTDTNAARAIIRWRPTLVDRGTRPGLTLKADVRAATYSTHTNYEAAGIEATLGRGNEDVWQQIGAASYGVHGHTPFLWDQVQVRSEVFVGKRVAVHAYRFETSLHYDLHRHEIYEVEMAVGKQFRCIEPEIRYSNRRRMVYLIVRAPGFGSGTPEP